MASGFILLPTGTELGKGRTCGKFSQDGGQLVRVTREGGFSAFESMNGRILYYAKTRFDNPEIWKTPVKGGAESRVSSLCGRARGPIGQSRKKAFCS